MDPVIEGLVAIEVVVLISTDYPPVLSPLQEEDKADPAQLCS